MPTGRDLDLNGLSAPENHRHYLGLDGLRAVAVLMVLLQHYLHVRAWGVWGWTGVRIFFALSGFLITGILYDTRHAEHRWSAFYARRALRIFPLYYAVLLLGLVLYPIFRWSSHPSYWMWPLYLENYARFVWPGDVPLLVVDHLQSTRIGHPPFLMLYGHLWSLAVEEQFYLIWPAVVFAVKRRETLLKISLATLVLAPIARLICAEYLPRAILDVGFEERFTPLQFDAFLAGALFALWLRGPHPDLTRLARRLLAILAIMLVGAEICCPLLYHRPLEPAIGQPIFASLGMSCVDLGGAALVLLAIDPKTRFSKLLETRPLRYIGKISYGFYIFHEPPHVFYEYLRAKTGLPNPYNAGSALIAFACTVVIASVSFYGFELPFLRLKRYFTVRQTEPAKTPTAA